MRIFRTDAHTELNNIASPRTESNDAGLNQLTEHSATTFSSTAGQVSEPASNSEFEWRYWLAVHAAPGIGARTFLKLLTCFGSPQAILDAPRSVLHDCRLKEDTVEALHNPDWQHIDKTLTWLAEHDGQLLTLADTGYPELLKQITDPPAFLYVLGNVSLLNTPQIAMVGSRNPTHSGADTAFDFAAHLARSGLTVTSGMALGIDAQCHHGALSVQGRSVAVIGTGIDRIYPASNKQLAKLLAQQGVIISEFPLGTAPLSQNFPLRNRIISGLSLGVVVVEAALKSGSLITARQAIEQNREVFAIPGSIHSPQSRGCHALIRQGAKLVETAQDLLEELAEVNLQPISASISHGTARQDSDHNLINLEPGYEQVLNCVGYEPTSVDLIVSRSGLTTDAVCSMLLVLELQNIIVSTASGQYSRTSQTSIV